MLIYLIGFMGCGKTTVGKQLAHKLNYEFVDLDSLIESSLNATISETFATDGEAYFREMECKYLHQTFQLQNTVISCGGGAPCFFDNIEMMNKNGLTIYLKLPVSALKSRVKFSQAKRPLLKDLNDNELLSFINTKLTERSPYYNQAKIVTDGLSININKLMEAVQLNSK